MLGHLSESHPDPNLDPDPGPTKCARILTQFNGAGFGQTDFLDALGLGLGRFNGLRALALGDLLDAVVFGVGRQFNGGLELAILALDLLRLDFDLLATLDDVDLDLLVSDFLPDFGRLQFVG